MFTQQRFIDVTVEHYDRIKKIESAEYSEKLLDAQIDIVTKVIKSEATSNYSTLYAAVENCDIDVDVREELDEFDNILREENDKKARLKIMIKKLQQLNDEREKTCSEITCLKEAKSGSEGRQGYSSDMLAELEDYTVKELAARHSRAYINAAYMLKDAE